VNGDLSGEVTLDGLGRDAALHAKARVERMELGAVHCQTAALSLDAQDGKVAGDVELAHGDGSLRAKLESGLIWGSQLAPKIDDTTPTHAQLIAKDFRIGSLQPFVAEQVSALDGRLSANLESRSQNGATTIDGNAQLTKGRVQVPAIGQEFHGIRARVVATAGGVFKVEDVVARGREGRVRAAAAGRLDGLTLRTARARLAIAEREKLPLTTQGIEIGDGWGAIDVTLLTSADGKTTTVNLDAPTFHLDLPDTQQHSLQSLDDAPNIRVGARIDPKNFHALPLQPLKDPPKPSDSRTILNIALGRDVWVRQGTSMRAALGGTLRVELGNEMTVAGTIRLSGGRLDVQGKRFEVEQGTVTFQGDDPTNPVVLATARYDAPGNYRVYAEFVGPVKTGKLKLRSEPPLPEDEILSLLLYGVPEGSFGSGSSSDDPAATAVGVGGGTATQGLNAALADLTNLDVSTRVDTSRGSPSPELVIQLTRRLSAQVGYNLGTPSLGQAPDRTFITLDLRLKRRWSLDTTVGDHGGTMVDAIWRHRY
jgi:translocation and assembly module TamB